MYDIYHVTFFLPKCENFEVIAKFRLYPPKLKYPATTEEEVSNLSGKQIGNFNKHKVKAVIADAQNVVR